MLRLNGGLADSTRNTFKLYYVPSYDKWWVKLRNMVCNFENIPSQQLQNPEVRDIIIPVQNYSDAGSWLKLAERRLIRFDP